MSQNDKVTLIPRLDKKTTELLNLTVLQRIDPLVEESCITAGHVTFYEFNINDGQWSRKNVEGTLFFVRRNGEPRFQFIVMNRLSDDNLVENILGDFEYEVHVPYLLNRNDSQEVNGIWFYNTYECEKVANFIQRILDESSNVLTKPEVLSTESTFNEQKTVATLTVMDGLIKPSSSTTANEPHFYDDQSIANFLKTAVNISGTSTHEGTPVEAHHHSPPVQSDHSHSVTLPILQSLQSPASSPTDPIMSMFENIGSNTATKHATALVKPSTFCAPPLSLPLNVPSKTSYVHTSPLGHPGNLQQPVGVPSLQPFPSWTPLSSSLTPTSVPTPNHGPIISREKVMAALQLLIQVLRDLDRDIHYSNPRFLRG